MSPGFSYPYGMILKAFQELLKGQKGFFDLRNLTINCLCLGIA